MAPRKKIKFLKKLCLEAFEQSLKSVWNKALKHATDVNINEILRGFQVAVYENTPETLHHDLGNCCISALDSWFWFIKTENKGQITNAENIIGKLAKVILNRKIRKIDSDIRFYVPVAEAILQNLCEMSGLEEFDLDNFTGLAPTSVQEHLSNSATSLSNLRNFSASWCNFNDELIQIICRNCPELRSLCVHCCEEVTDASIDSILLCARLEEVYISCTSVTSAGLVRLIQGSVSLKKLDHVKGPEVIDILKETCPSRRYNLRSFGDTFWNNEDLRAVANFFPSLSSVDVYSEEANIFNDITLNLKEINIMAPSLNLIFNSLTSFLSVRGSSITKLDLDTSDEVTGQKIFDTCALCPNIEELSIARFRHSSVDYEDRIDNFADLQRRNPTLLMSIRSCNPFKKLRKLEVNFDKTLVQYTPNVEELYFYCSSLSDEFFQNLFQFNQLEHVKRLNLSTAKLSANTLKMLIVNCKKLENIRLSVERSVVMEAIVKEVKIFITVNNYGVNFDANLF